MKTISIADRDDDIIRDVKRKMIDEMNARTETELATLIGAVLNPDSKATFPMH